jgi:poly(3-hydroxybutyrate) depolymerase
MSTYPRCKTGDGCIPLPDSTPENVVITPNQNSTWNCKLNKRDVGRVVINWGHSIADGKWACNSWNPQCIVGNKACTVIKE